MDSRGTVVGAKAQKVPPFLKKLVDLTNSCPPHIGAWNEDGTHFVVKSSQFADLLREQFQGTLQTFVRQLHFYSFNKKDDGSTGTWTFSHANFLRGQPHLLVHIERKSNPKRKNQKEDEDEVSGDKDSSPEQGTSQAVEARLSYLERQLLRMSSMEKELATLKQELVAFKELAAAQNLLSLAPGITKKRVSKDDQELLSKEKLSSQPKSLEKDDNLLSLLPPPKKVTRLTSVDSAFELKDFPFEDTSSLGSVSVRDLMRELQYGIFADFDEFLPSSSKVEAATAVPSTPMSDTTSSGEVGPCGNKEDFFNIPNGFVLQPGVTVSLLKQAFNVIARQCCPSSGGVQGGSLRRLCDELPNPATMPPVETCDVSRELLPILRENVEEEASDLALMRASRQVYEVYYATVKKKLQDKMVDGAARTPCQQHATEATQ